MVDKASSAHGGSSSTYLVDLTGTGVAPIGALSSSSTNYFLVNGSGTGQTATVTASNSGNGNLSGITTNAAGTISNFRGTIGSGTTSSATGFQGAASSISLGDATSKTYSYSFAPTVKAQTASTMVVATLSNGSSNGQNAAFNQTLTLTGTGVAPVLSVASTSNTTQYVRIGTTGTSSITVSNIGNGNLATGGPSPASNLNFSVSPTLGSGFAASSVNQTSYSLADSTSGTVAATSSTLAYTYTPTSRTGPAGATVALGFSNGSANGSNTGGTISSVFNAQGVGPTYTNTNYATATNTAGLAGSISTISTPTASPHGSIGTAGATISFGTVGYKQAETLYLLLQNTTTDSGTADLTNLTIESYSIAGAGAYEFSPTLQAGSVISAGGQLLLPITITSSGGGALNSTLTIFTDEGSSLGGIGDTFTYSLTAFAVPEPATIAVLGAGLAGLAGIRRRRKQTVKV